MYQYVTAASIVLVFTWFWAKSRPRKLPPGPLCLPLLDNLLDLGFDAEFAEKLKKEHKKHGPIISASLVGHGIWDVWVEGYDLIKEMLHDSRFTNRSVFGPMVDMKANQGLAWTPGNVAKSKRKVIVQIMRSIGVGKTVFSAGVEEETEYLLQHLDTSVGKPLFLQVPQT